MAFHPFQTETGEPVGSFEVFFWSLAEAEAEPPENWDSLNLPDDTTPADRVGFYWWPCFAGCLPDSEPVGPFATEAEAIADATQTF